MLAAHRDGRKFGQLPYLVMLGFVVAMVVLVRRTRVAAPGPSLMTE